MKFSASNCLMLVLCFCLAAWQLGCGTSPTKQLQADASNEGDAQSGVREEDTAADTTGESASPKASQESNASPGMATEGRSLFDGKSIDGWETIEFGGEGDVEIVDGELRMYAGDPLTGICVTEAIELPTSNYEFSIEAMKLSGSDFFCAVTFPVNDTFCTLIVGGWGGTLVGLSNLDGQDASENKAKLMRKFLKDQWYAIRIQVLPNRIAAWIDDEKVIDESIEGVEVSVRGDITTTTPLGIFNFLTSSSFRDIKMRKLD